MNAQYPLGQDVPVLPIDYSGCEDVEFVPGLDVPQLRDPDTIDFAQSRLHAVQEELRFAKCELQRLHLVNEGLASRIQTVEAERDRIDRRLSALLAERRPKAPGTSVGDYTAHSAVAAEYTAFIEQDLYVLARTCTRGIWSPGPNVPSVIGALCRALFRGSEPDQAALGQTFTYTAPVAPARLDRILNHALKIRSMARNASSPGRWDFAYTSGVPLDHHRQQPWGSCDPDAPTRILVAPAYLAGNQVYRLQQVYTTPARL